MKMKLKRKLHKRNHRPRVYKDVLLKSREVVFNCTSKSNPDTMYTGSFDTAISMAHIKSHWDQIKSSLGENDMGELISITNASSHHLCGYCGQVVKGTDRNLLCDECRELFGHKYLSEL